VPVPVLVGVGAAAASPAVIVTTKPPRSVGAFENETVVALDVDDAMATPKTVPLHEPLKECVIVQPISTVS
jgi:hypothetical protein